MIYLDLCALWRIVENLDSKNGMEEVRSSILLGSTKNPQVHALGFIAFSDEASAGRPVSADVALPPSIRVGVVMNGFGAAKQRQRSWHGMIGLHLSDSP